MNLNVPSSDMVEADLATIKKNLDRLFGSEWPTYELETISLELGFAFPELLKDKISVLQLMTRDPDLFTEDVAFFVHAVAVMNNHVADFDHFNLPSSLEIAYAILLHRYLFPDHVVYGSGVTKTVAYILNLEGYSEAITPFNLCGVSNSDLTPGQLPQDTENKKLAVRQYVKAMSNV